MEDRCLCLMFYLQQIIEHLKLYTLVGEGERIYPMSTNEGYPLIDEDKEMVKQFHEWFFDNAETLKDTVISPPSSVAM